MMNLILLFSSILFPVGQHFILDDAIYYLEFNCRCSRSIFSMLFSACFNHRHVSAEFATALKGCMSKIIQTVLSNFNITIIEKKFIPAKA